jgi:predicted phage replisome organizer
MSESKKYFYLKLKDNFFDSDEMKVLQGLENGYLYSDILLKLYLKSLKSDGRLMFKEHIPYDVKMISIVTNHNIAIVEKALKTLNDLGLICVLDNGAIYMIDIQNFIGESSTEGDRKRAYRNKIASESLELNSGQTSGQMSGQKSDNHPPELEIELETKIEKELEIEPPKSPKRKSTKSKRLETPTVQKHQYAEFVAMTNDEYKSLVDNEHLGTQTAVNRCIEILDNYKGANGKKYKSDYRAILTWVIDRYREEQQKQGLCSQRGIPPNGSVPENPQAAMARRAIELLKKQEAPDGQTD